MPGRFLSVIRPFAKFMPEVKPPARKIGFGEKIFWTGIVLIIYLVMSEVPLYGVPGAREATDPLRYLRVIFASNRGTLMELGIGPIVTAGLILQLMAGSGMISVDMSKSEDRALFTSASKLLSIVMILFNASAYLYGGAYGSIDFNAAVIIFLQLIAATMVLMLLDELVQKGWGIGSGISLFIVAGVAQKIWWDCFAPIPATVTGAEDGFFYGALIAFFQAIWDGKSVLNWFHRPGKNPPPDMLGFLATVAVFLLVTYIEGIRVELPIAHARFRGYRGRYPVKLLYVSNVPVILASALFANIYLFSQIIWNRFNRDNANFWLNLIGKYSEASGTPEPVSGLAYFVVPPRNLTAVMNDPVRAGVYAVLMIAFCATFASVWIQVGGLSPRTVAKQLMDAGMQIPGFRRSYGAIESVLERYIPTVTILGGLVVGAVAAFADFLGAFGTGMGILLTIGIMWQYYQLLAQERILDMYPVVGRVLGGR
jgi:preprotein translocase SecY subunit